jgi:serine protease DegQ
VFEQIIRDGEVTRGWFGIEPVSVTPDVAKALSLSPAEGVLIRSLQRGGPAERAGIMVKDVFVEVGGKPTLSVPQLLSRIADLPPGSSAKVKLVRDGKPVDIDIVVGKRPKPAEQ